MPFTGATLTAAEVAAEAYKAYSPLTNEFVWLPDGGCRVVPLTWWDDASYAAYQGDSQANLD